MTHPTRRSGLRALADTCSDPLDCLLHHPFRTRSCRPRSREEGSYGKPVRTMPQLHLPDVVLVHGGAHAADCWDWTIAELACQEPSLRVLAVDLPGRGRSPADLA